MIDPAYFVVWDGALEKNKLAPGLSGFQGPSQIKNAGFYSEPVSFTKEEWKAIQAQTTGRVLPTPSEVRAKKKQGCGWQALGQFYGLGVGVLKKIAKSH